MSTQIITPTKPALEVITEQPKNLFYAAYGSNLNVPQMAGRCPGAVPAARVLLPDWKLVFRGVADIVESAGDAVPVGLWRITDACESALDGYEGYPNLYGKRYWRWHGGGDDAVIMAYVMNDRSYIEAPGTDYFLSIDDGYIDFSLPKSYLESALAESYRQERETRNVRYNRYNGNYGYSGTNDYLYQDSYSANIPAAPSKADAECQELDESLELQDIRERMQDHTTGELTDYASGMIGDDNEHAIACDILANRENAAIDADSRWQD